MSCRLGPLALYTMHDPENTSFRPKLSPCSAALLLCLASPNLFASQFADLKRMEPVPPNEQIPIVDFVRPALFSDVQLNYTGTQIGAIVPGDDDHTNLITYDLTTRKLDGITAPVGDNDISAFAWLDGNHLSYIISKRKLGGVELLQSEAGTLTISQPVHVAVPASLIQIFGSPPDDRTQILVNLRGPRLRYDVTEMINAMNRGDLVTRYPDLKTDHGFNIKPVADKLGKLAFGVTQEDGVLSLSRIENDSWVKCPEDLDQVDLIGSGDNPGEIVVIGLRDGLSPRPLETMDAATGKAKEVILQDKEYDFDGWLFRDPGSHNIVGAVYDRAAPHVVWFTETYRNLQQAVDKLFPNQVVRILAMDDGGKVLLISSGSDRQPVVYSWVNLEKHTSGLIKNSAPWIDPKRMRPIGVIKYATAEGSQMDAYLTLPAGSTKAIPPPLVVIPNDSSANRWVWGFNREVQFLASRGYAVLQANHRGSAGYTWMFPEEERWDFLKMSDDVARATKKAIGTGLVDGNRVAIMGSDFGGYLAAAGAALEPGLYKCALSVSAVYDWGKYINEDKYRQFTNATYSRYLYKLGDPHKNPGKFNSFSPLPLAGQIRSAMFIAWGEFDHPEVIGQSKEMASAAKTNNVPVDTLSFLDEGSRVRHLAHKIELYQHIEDFLSKNL